MDDNLVIFVVDDDPAARNSLAALVKSRGLAVETFSSAEDFLAGYEPRKRGCLIADVRMTGMSGLDLLEQMSAKGLNVPVIVITGFADVPIYGTLPAEQIPHAVFPWERLQAKHGQTPYGKADR